MFSLFFRSRQQILNLICTAKKTESWLFHSKSPHKISTEQLTQAHAAPALRLSQENGVFLDKLEMASTEK